jgi:hypothetical protein
MPKTSSSARTKSPKKVTTKSTAKKPTAVASLQAARPRGLKRLNYNRWRQERTEHISRQLRLPNVWRITVQATRLLWQYRVLLAGIILIYGVLTILLVKGLTSSTNVSSLKSELSHSFSGGWGGLASGLTIFVALLGSNGNGSSSTAGAYQVLLLILVSLAVIWTLRQLLAGHRPRIRDAYYRGMYPLVPFVLVLIIIGLQLLPLVLGTAIYGQVLANGIAVNGIEKLLWFSFFALLALWSLYMVTASLFALYIVTLPDMTPLSALRSARELVKYRRWTVLLKVLYLPVLLVIVGMVIVLPVIAIAAPLAQWVFYLLSIGALAAVHTYMYTLYRNLLGEKSAGAQA